jgi:HK97 family phage prohead protease
MEYRFVTKKQFRVICSKGKPDDNIAVVKFVPGDIRQFSEDEENKILQFTISTGALDRDNDTISPNGWRLDEFKKNPVILWAHDNQNPPIAKSVSVWLEGDKLKSRGQFLPSDMGDHDHIKFADMIYQMFKQGYMSGVSVGFKPHKWIENDERAGWWPLDYIDQTLLEYSAVPVPSNPEALHEAESRGIDLSPLKQWTEIILDDGSSVITVPKGIAEEIRKNLTAPIVQVSKEIKMEPPKKEQKIESENKEPEIESENKETEETEEEVTVEVTKTVDKESVVETLTKAQEVFDSMIDDVVESITFIKDNASKAGRVLSAANENKLRDAHSQIGDVLAKLDTQDDDDDKNLIPFTKSDGTEILLTPEQHEDLKQMIADEIRMRSTGQLPG